ncbi:MAG: TIGR03557 family F420-dependent LLM class oxidoreductase [Hyphomicrobiales bacterium]
MVEIGYTLSSEETGPRELVRLAAMAEDYGFTFALMSDHYHPWVTNQGQSPFAWATLGGISRSTSRLRVGTGVTCPTMRIHPAIIAQAAATVADMFEGRFFLGLGAGENLNEHIFGDHWPQPATRNEMLMEAIDIIRALWTGDEVNHYGDYFTVDEAKLFTRPQQPPPIYVAASGPKAAELAAENDGLIGTAPNRNVIDAFEQAGGRGKPRIAQLTVCYDEDEERAKQTATHYWPNAGLAGNVNWEIKTVDHFDQLCQMVTPDIIAKTVVVGPDPQKYLEAINAYAEAGYTHVYAHQVGPDQEKWMTFAAKEILPKFGQQAAGTEPAMADRELGARA